MSQNTRKKLVVTAFVWLAVMMLIGQPPNAHAAPPRAPAIEVHVVQAGETLETIAATFHVSPARLAEVNNIGDPSSISIGDRLVIPHEPGLIAANAGAKVIVGLGDTLDVLAAQHQTTEKEIGLANEIVRADLIVAGQTLVIPGPDTNAPDADVIRLSAAMPLWRAALAANSNIFAVALANHLNSISDANNGGLIRVAAGGRKSPVLAPPWVVLRLNTAPLEAGRTASIDVTVDGPGTLTATFLDRDIHFVGAGNDYSGIFGIERWTRPGLYPLSITFTDPTGKVSTIVRNVMVVHGNYASEILKLSEDAVAVRSDPQVIAAELAYLTQKMSGFTPQRYWNGLFRIPAPGILTSAFGSVRSINGGGYDAYHSGNDLATSTGTPIYAPADGIVVDTGLLEVRGYTTIIDHGMGVYTGYWHQAGISVHPGDKVTAGQQIGVVGNTGSSTASHLHWEMWVGGVPVDSLQWVRQSFP